MQQSADLRNIRSLMHYHQAMGIKEYPRNADVQRFIELTNPDGVNKLRNRKEASLLHKSPPLPESKESTESAFQSLQQEVVSCTLCHLAANRLGSVPGKGRINSRLMVVGDWSSQDHNFTREVLFGPEEDIMLWKMMAAIELDPEEVYVTNCIKCCPDGNRHPDRECETRCFSYLSREIAAVNPKIICAMGDIAARMLTGSKDMLVRMRGRIMGYRHDPSVAVAVIPTFHPRFLLRNPEMKKATWNDLQAIMRRLAGSDV